MQGVTSNATRTRPERGYLGLLRAVALIAMLAGAAGSVGLMLRACHRNPSRLLLVLLAIWVLSPIIALVLANMASKRWSVVTRATLHGLTLVVPLGSLAIYIELVDLKPAGSPNAFLFVAVPPASWIIMAIVVALAALISRRRSQRGAGA